MYLKSFTLVYCVNRKLQIEYDKKSYFLMKQQTKVEKKDAYIKAV